MINVLCSGLITLSRHSIKKQRLESLSKGDNYANEAIVDQWADYLSKRAALYTDIKVDGCRIRLVNSHMSSFFNETIQKRAERIVQAEEIVEKMGCRWDFAIIGMDMNDVPSKLTLKSINLNYTIIARGKWRYSGTVHHLHRCWIY